ncbi:MAG: cellulase [Flammeovirgaceae bacterium]|nr:cellulase [Flammeovirgaceae bacterium]MBE62627.1 cellulase [Flammeovirgaceae bacterium]HCX20543.1 cellulase [Cytophagales bacterium]
MKVTGLIKFCSGFILLCILNQCAFTDKYRETESIVRLNQIGYPTAGVKVAAVVSPNLDQFEIRNLDGQVVYTGQVLQPEYWDLSDEKVSILDFSEFNHQGTYYLQSGNAKSQKFQISDQPYTELIKSSAKTFYFNRATTELPEKYAGIYQRPFSHPDTAVVVHASAAGDFMSAGTSISTPYGWYDAGDFNKYVVNSGISTYTLLIAYEHYSALYDSLTWNIPESVNDQADLIDEILWNVRWMETMQDTLDGGVYHKTTTADFEGFMEADKASSQRYVVKKGTAATLDFAAVMAKTSTIIKEIDSSYAELLLVKANAAWDWAIKHPEVVYKNPVSNDPKYPSIRTGEYGDGHFQDEFFWAATELYLATGNESYLENYSIESLGSFEVPDWSSVETLGLISLASSDINNGLKKKASDELKELSERLITQWRESPYRVTIERFAWGSNSVILNESLVLINAYRALGNVEYFEAAVSGLDYVLGRNATGYCFVTGFGAKSPMNIHHRQSAADHVKEPIPGFLVGGPNPRNIHQDCGADSYKEQLPAKCYIDEECSYSTNEVAINWNAPLVYVAGAIHSIYEERFSK